MIRRKIAMAVAAFGLLLGVAAVAGPAQAALAAPAAHAAPAAPAALPLPSCPIINPGTAPNLSGQCWFNIETGAAGYLGANDNHTHYRFVTTNLVNTPQLVNLDGTGINGAVGAELCDPNNHTGGNGGWAAQIGLFGNAGGPTQANTVFYAAGFWPPGVPDPCVNHAPLVPDPDSATNCPPGGTGSVTGTSPNVFCGSFSPVAVNAVLNGLAVYYVPAGHFFHRISFGFCVQGGVCQQAFTDSTVLVNIWEFGIGAFNEAQNLSAPASILLDTFSSDMVTCYSCKGPVGISQVQPVNPFGTGGLQEAQSVNTSGQVVMSPLNSLTTANVFEVSNGSTSLGRAAEPGPAASPAVAAGPRPEGGNRMTTDDLARLAQLARDWDARAAQLERDHIMTDIAGIYRRCAGQLRDTVAGITPAGQET